MEITTTGIEEIICPNVPVLNFRGANAAFKTQTDLMLADVDRLIEYIVNKDKNVLYELLTTNKAVVSKDTHRGSYLFGSFNEMEKKDKHAVTPSKPPAGKYIYIRVQISI